MLIIILLRSELVIIMLKKSEVYEFDLYITLLYTCFLKDNLLIIIH